MYKLNLLCGSNLVGIDDDYIQIDIDQPTNSGMDQYIDKRYNINNLINTKKFIQLDVNNDNLPFPDNSVKEIISHRGVGRGYIKNFNEILRVLSPQGKLILYNSWFRMLLKLLRLFDNINIECMNTNNSISIIMCWDFKLTCYNKK